MSVSVTYQERLDYLNKNFDPRTGLRNRYIFLNPNEGDYFLVNFSDVISLIQVVIRVGDYAKIKFIEAVPKNMVDICHNNEVWIHISTIEFLE